MNVGQHLLCQDVYAPHPRRTSSALQLVHDLALRSLSTVTENTPCNSGISWLTLCHGFGRRRSKRRQPRWPRRVQVGGCPGFTTPRELPRSQSHGPYVSFLLTISHHLRLTSRSRGPLAKEQRSKLVCQRRHVRRRPVRRRSSQRGNTSDQRSRRKCS